MALHLSGEGFHAGEVGLGLRGGKQPAIRGKGDVRRRVAKVRVRGDCVRLAAAFPAGPPLC